MRRLCGEEEVVVVVEVGVFWAKQENLWLEASESMEGQIGKPMGVRPCVRACASSEGLEDLLFSSSQAVKFLSS